MLLSIVMMIKNEERYLEKTLSSLGDLMNNIESELVILDTGSTDKSVEICKRYTDKVYFSQWNNNFSDMRNKSISYANGEWILILDADEELIEVKKMIDFFNSDLHLKYNCASVVFKNISSSDKKLYTESLNLRLFKNKNFRYEGAIHEQPIYKEPIYNSIAVLNHYGYLYEDEEFKQKKLKRNEKILLKEIKKNSQDPYINFQLGKNYLSLDEKEEAIAYMEKSMYLYRQYGIIPSYIYSNLARLYIDLDEFDKCEKVCIEYLQKKDDKNIDIYYFLAVSQNFLYKYKDSLNNYKKYIYLVDNYDISTQANSIYADGITIGLKKYAQMGIIRNYYHLGEYKKVIEELENIEFEEIKEIYDIIFKSLYKTKKIEEILNIYNKKTSSIINTKYVECSIESMILKIKENDRKNIYKVLSNIDNNYGLLNKIRLGEEFNVKELNKLLLDERQSYYADIIYYAIKNDLDIFELLKNVGYSYMKDYFNYIIQYKRDCLPKLYEIVLKVPNTLNLNKLNICSCICKSLLIDNCFYNDKYEKIFYMYITYRYSFIKQVYNQNLSDEEIICLLKDKDDEFVVKFNLVQKLKNKDPLRYIREIKNLIIDNKEYKKAIEILITKFSKSIHESDELKKQYKFLIENNINNGNINDAISMIEEYVDIFEKDIEIYNMLGIIKILQGRLDESEDLFKNAFLLNNTNENTLYNIGHLKELKEEYGEAINFYRQSLYFVKEENLKIELNSKIDELNKFLKINDLNSQLDNQIYKDKIQSLINDNKLNEAKEELELYKQNVGNDSSAYSMEGIINLCQGDLKSAYDSFYNGLQIYNDNLDLLYNIAYVNRLLGNLEESINNYEKCLSLSDDNKLNNEIKVVLQEMNAIYCSTIQNKTIILVGIDEDDEILNLLDQSNNKVILAKQHDNIDYLNKYNDDENSIFIFTEISKLFLLKERKYRFKSIYYINEKNSDIEDAKMIYNEIQAYNYCDLILTKDIYTYTYKKIIENNSKIYLFDTNSSITFNINYILENYNERKNSKLVEDLKEKIENLDNEYEKMFYMMIYNIENNVELENIAHYIYEKYNTKESYRIYMSLLIKNKNYKQIINLILNNDYCSESIKAEVIYLEVLGKYELLEFILNIHIKNFSCLNSISIEDIDYKMALCHFELGNFNRAYEKYMIVIENSAHLVKSPIVNKNIAYLMYLNRHDGYRLYHDKYKQMLECLN